MKKIFISILLTVSAVSMFAQTNNIENQLIQECEELIVKKMEQDRIVGVSAAIVLNDSIIWKKGFGYADKEAQIPMTEKTVVNIGSVTKTFTALAIMQLHEKGLINITQPLNKYLAQFHPKTRYESLDDVTIKSLITHTSGIQPDIWKNSDLASGKYTDVIDFINETYLLYPAAKIGIYSNSAYNILGHLVKEVSGLDYPDYVHKNILQPLEMANSGFFWDSLENRTKIYDGNTEHKDFPLRDIASGGIYADIVNFAKYAKGLIDAYNGNSSVIKKKTANEMFSIQNQDVVIETSNNKKGLGWFLFENDSSIAILHSGSAGYAHAELIVFPKQKAAFVILNNTSSGGKLNEDYCINMLNHFELSIPDLYPKTIVAEIHPIESLVSPEKEILNKHVGFYAENFSYSKVSLVNDTLRLIRNGTQIKLHWVSKNEFIPVRANDKNNLQFSENERYIFKVIENYHILIHKQENKETVLGYKFHGVNSSQWIQKIGIYDHFGYQLIAGDTKLKGANIQLNNDKILILELMTFENTISIPLDVISEKYAITAGVTSGFGYTVKFTEDENYHYIDFAGITFRKEKLNINNS